MFSCKIYTERKSENIFMYFLFSFKISEKTFFADYFRVTASVSFLMCFSPSLFNADRAWKQSFYYFKNSNRQCDSLISWLSYDIKLYQVISFIKLYKRVLMWQLETHLFASSYIWLAYIFEASYSTTMTSVSKKSSVDQSELEK